MQKKYVWNPATCTCENNKYLESIIDDPVTTCDEIINTEDSVSTFATRTVSRNFHEKNVRYKMDR